MLHQEIFIWYEGNKDERGANWFCSRVGNDIATCVTRYCAENREIDLSPGAVNWAHSEDYRPPRDELDEKLDKGYIYRAGERCYQRRCGVLYVKYDREKDWRPLVRRLPTWRS